MWWFRPAALSVSRMFPDGVDWHCHLLPGVDDGAPDAAQSLDMLRELRRAGLRAVCCTPHIMQRYPNRPGDLQRRFAELQRCVGAEGPELLLAAEYMIDEGFESRLHSEPLLLRPDGALLVELPQFMLPEGWMDSLLLVRELGYTPLLAHPERYYRLLSVDVLREIAGQGVQFQGNIGSLLGYYGESVRVLAERLRAESLYSCWGSDAHSAQMCRRLFSRMRA